MERRRFGGQQTAVCFLFKWRLESRIRMDGLLDGKPNEQPLLVSVNERKLVAWDRGTYGCVAELLVLLVAAVP